jgi:chromate transporter
VIDIAANETTAEAGAGHGISLAEAFRVWLRVALLSFGGPAGRIAVMHRILVEEKNWISESRFLHALNYCMLLPGPEAQQLATGADPGDLGCDRGVPLQHGHADGARGLLLRPVGMI